MFLSLSLSLSPSQKSTITWGASYYYENAWHIKFDNKEKCEGKLTQQNGLTE